MTRSTTSRRFLCIFAVAALMTGFSALLLPKAFGQIIIKRTCFVAPPGSPNRPADCNAPIATCDPMVYDCGWLLGTGNSRKNFTEKPYRFCADSQNVCVCEQSWFYAACLEFDVYRTAACGGFLCNGQVVFQDCYNDCP